MEIEMQTLMETILFVPNPDNFIFKIVEKVKERHIEVHVSSKSMDDVFVSYNVTQFAWCENRKTGNITVAFLCERDYLFIFHNDVKMRVRCRKQWTALEVNDNDEVVVRFEGPPTISYTFCKDGKVLTT
jgi:hypothetical protein